MMHLILKTLVRQPVPMVWAGFDRSLFDRLSPPFPPVDVVRFDGCLPGNVVHLRLNFFLFRQDWISSIVDQQTLPTADRPDEIFFVDEGTQLPFFLRYWRHRHRLLRDASGGTLIVDDVTFQSPFRLMDYLLYPVLWLQFAYRKPVYRAVFGNR